MRLFFSYSDALNRQRDDMTAMQKKYSFVKYVSRVCVNEMFVIIFLGAILMFVMSLSIVCGV